MAEPTIELRKIRDFGQNLSDTFEFIREHFKPLLRSFLAIAGIFIVLMAIMTGVLESGIFSSLKLLSRSQDPASFSVSSSLYSSYFSLHFLLYFLSIWIGYTAMQVVIGAYMKYADEHAGARPDIEDVWRIFSRYYLKVLLYMIPVILLIAVGAILCIVPGLYLMVVLVPFTWIVMIEEADFGTAIQRCFELIRGNFWVSTLLYIVTTLIYSFASGLIGVLVGVLSGSLTYVTTADLSATIGMIAAVMRIFGFLFYIIFLVSAVLHYFNLVEQKDAVGMTRRIEHIGEAPGSGENDSAQY